MKRAQGNSGGVGSGRWLGRNTAAREEARRLVLLWGWNATAYQILNPGVRLWFSGDGDAVVGYVLASGVRVVAGAPICALERLPDVVREFEDSARRARHGVCYFGAAQRLEELLRDDKRCSRVMLGAQPVWDPRGWSLMVAGHASLRAQLRRARNKGARVAEWSREQARSDARLHRCAREWIESRGLPPLHFLVEPRVLDDLGERRLWVALSASTCGGEESVAAYLVASPVPARGGWLLEQFVRAPGAPNGAVELLIDAAMSRLGEEGAGFVTMGLAPLCRACDPGDSGEGEPGWLGLVLALTRAHTRRFYNFDGLEAFKSKMRPDFWEPIWAVSRERSFSPRTLWAIMGAFGRQPPARLLSHAVLRAAAQEWRWWRARQPPRA